MIDDEDWDEWMKLSEAEQEAMLQSEMNQLVELWEQMTPAQQYAARRSSTLQVCRGWRRVLRTFSNMPFAREQLREAQIRLLKLRVERATGITPGNA